MRKIIPKRLALKPLIVVAAAITTALPASADDLDVFHAVLASQNKPNILFVLDYSGSMEYDINDDENVHGDNDDDTESKSEILNDAVNTLLIENSGRVNVGLGSNYAKYASGVRWPISDLEVDANTIDPAIPAGTVTAADAISSQLTRTPTGGYTATVNGLAEAARYFRGDAVLHGDADVNIPQLHEPDVWDAVNERYDSGNHLTAMPSSYTPTDAYQTDSWTTPTYVSPLTNECQTNFIVLISDGKPTKLNDDTSLTSVLQNAGVGGGDVANCTDLSDTIFDDLTGDDAQYKGKGNCGPEILNYLATTDINPAISGSNVITHTIGFGIDGYGADYLELLAQSGNGDFYEATAPEELTKALNDVINSILAGSENFAELSIDVNPSTFSHDDRTYFSLFSPSVKSSWKGNLKGFFLDETGLKDVKDELATVNGGLGLRFADTSQSFWSSVADGNNIESGGASESITDLEATASTRKIYTSVLGTGTDLSSGNGSRLRKENSDITNALMGNPAAGVRDAALDWITYAPMGDPLHTKPVVINYDASGVKTKVIYTMTNQGLLHAFDATNPTAPDADNPVISGGEELFAFMPKELLSNLPALYAPTTSNEHVYGLDGTLTRWHNDDNKDGYVNGNDTVQLIFGMRRGGSNYYSLDVTDPESPEFKWQVSATDPVFAGLAQTWSRAALVTVNYSGAPKRVLMFGGGYDAVTVDDTTAPTPASGNAVFMVNEDGQYVWSIDANDHADMKYSIPSDLSVLDTDNNGRVDRAYFGDLGGQVWRVDFDNVANNADTNIEILADLSNSAGDHQPVFYAPSISMNRKRGDQHFAVSVGTGDRTQPMLESTNNAFYMLKDKDYKVGPPPASFSTIIASSGPCSVGSPCGLYDATNNDIGSSNAAIRETAKTQLKSAMGWKVMLDAGEKSLSKIVSFEGKFLATTFHPEQPLDEFGKPDPCSFNMTGRLYVMNIADARPIQINADGTETEYELDQSTRVTTLNGTTIPSSPVIVFPADSSQVQIIVDKESVVAVNKRITTVYWHAK